MDPTRTFEIRSIWTGNIRIDVIADGRQTGIALNDCIDNDMDLARFAADLRDVGFPRLAFGANDEFRVAVTSAGSDDAVRLTVDGMVEDGHETHSVTVAAKMRHDDLLAKLRALIADIVDHPTYLLGWLFFAELADETASRLFAAFDTEWETRTAGGEIEEDWDARVRAEAEYFREHYEMPARFLAHAARRRQAMLDLKPDRHGSLITERLE